MTDEACANCGHGLDAHGDSHYCAMFLAEYSAVKALRDRIAVLEGALVNARGNLVRALASSLEISDEFAAMIPSVTMIDATLNGEKK